MSKNGLMWKIITREQRCEVVNKKIIPICSFSLNQFTIKFVMQLPILSAKIQSFSCLCIKFQQLCV